MDTRSPRFYAEKVVTDAILGLLQLDEFKDVLRMGPDGAVEFAIIGTCDPDSYHALEFALVGLPQAEPEPEPEAVVEEPAAPEPEPVAPVAHGRGKANKKE